jgi:hypothetical protein
LSRVWAPKMDGAKLATDTAGHGNVCGRQASCSGKSLVERLGEPFRNENPGKSRNRAV